MHLSHHARLSVAPMMDWTDRHCRMFHRQFSRHALLYTEMVTAQAIVHGEPERLLGFSPAEGPVALQIGGSEPEVLFRACQIARDFPYVEVNLNVGCPSDRVQSGAFGACLMREPALVAECVAAMREACEVPVTVKCRIGVDEQDPHEVLPEFLARVGAAGVEHFIIHARKAWLQGLSPKENRDIPPLDYDLVLSMTGLFIGLSISLNGGITSLDEAEAHLDRGVQGVMIGRAAYHEPANILASADRRIFGADTPDVLAEDAVGAMLPYIDDYLTAGGRLHTITRHMLGAFAGRPGARAWRRTLSEGATAPGAGTALVEAALAEVTSRIAA
ncbi:tRNA dihydrouridine(20/20a) synthase DusA [Rubricella aquisinus]|nr:tRNA dihydrouridine(20/20a) synthase DusA [Rubricella aquisinus]